MTVLRIVALLGVALTGWIFGITLVLVLCQEVLAPWLPRRKRK